MTHIPTAREYVDHVAMCSRYSADDLTVFCAVADAVDALKKDRNSTIDVSTLSDAQRSAALGILLGLVVAHEITQDIREGVL